MCLSYPKNLAPRKEVVIKVNVERAATIWWRFNTEAPANTLHFTLLRVDAGNNHELVPNQKYECKQAVIDCRDVQPGSYHLIWANQESIVKSKMLAYEVLTHEL